MIIKRVSRITPQSKPSIALSDVGVDQSQSLIDASSDLTTKSR